jgi:hypothetical protein
MLHAQNSKGKVQFEVVDPESGDADLYAIKKTAASINDRMGKINAAEHWIAIGGDLAALKGALARPQGGQRRGDNERIGWVKAFELGILPISNHAFAYKIIEVHKFYSVNSIPTSNLPVAIVSLYVIASKIKDPKLVTRLIGEGRITAASTERDIRGLAHEMGLLAKNVRVPVNRNSPKSRRVETVLKLVQRLGLTISDLKQGDK